MHKGATEIQVRQATIDEIIELRWTVLREGLPREMADFPGDDDAGTRHFAAMRGSSVVGCASFMRQLWNGKSAWQLRGMAVAQDLRGTGVGAEILLFAEEALAREAFSDQLWCNARTPATGFYERQGWQRHGEEFIVETAGPHFKMTRRLGA